MTIADILVAEDSVDGSGLGRGPQMAIVRLGLRTLRLDDLEVQAGRIQRIAIHSNAM